MEITDEGGTSEQWWTGLNDQLELNKWVWSASNETIDSTISPLVYHSTTSLPYHEYCKTGFDSDGNVSVFFKLVKRSK